MCRVGNKNNGAEMNSRKRANMKSGGGIPVIMKKKKHAVEFMREKKCDLVVAHSIIHPVARIFRAEKQSNFSSNNPRHDHFGYCRKRFDSDKGTHQKVA